MSDQIKGISIGTWITFLTMVLGFGTSYGVIQTNLKVIETQLQDFKKTSERETNKIEILITQFSQQQRLIDANANEIKHLREIQKLKEHK